MPTNASRGLSTTEERSNESRTRVAMGWIALLFMLLGFLGVTVVLNVHQHGEQQFAYLAKSFLKGDLGFQEPPGESWADTSPYGGQHYWPLGPLPAILLMPFEFMATLFGGIFYQGYLQPLLVLAVLGFVYRIARITGYSCENSLYLAFGFAFATAFLGVGIWPWSWYFSQVITCLLLFASITEMVGRRRPWVLGIIFGLILATRATAMLGLVWCVGLILSERSTWKKKLLSLTAVAVPVLIVAAMLLVYNYERFHNPFDQGYAEQIIPAHAAAGRAVGILSPQHIPGNLYALLLAPPTPVRRDNLSLVLAFPYVVANPWGMSIWVTSPLFLCLFGFRLRDRTSVLLLLTVSMIALPILLYYGVGFRQFGYRYSLDFLPFLYYLLMRSYRQQRGELTAGFKTLALLSATFNLYLFYGHFVWGVGW